MAQRETLTELQNRLAARLQAAQTEGPSVHWLAVEAGGGRYLVPLNQAGEIFPWTTVQSTPYTKPWFLGVANLRGALCGVVDLGHFLAIDGLGVRSPSTLAECKLLSFNAALQINCALAVDRLAGLRGADAFALSAPALQDAPAYFGRIYTDAAGLPWQEIQLQALAQTTSFLAIDA
ncbi:chemotaxis protein CheW [Pseudorhodoferax sp. Leaf267]|uniref:chemotaxis protein CheW n=1 Tax=Pseudorhodoferax sp. Leaf267 TaxID=1736316 RepID=UPI0006F35ED9|nr:chemotaxis protein CheW [Pseudorhodoferax sp. Leaf267]KQP20581.1 chemotaxis protein CheW [Pseudorhodoferax sp. Leaf267]